MIGCRRGLDVLARVNVVPDPFPITNVDGVANIYVTGIYHRIATMIAATPNNAHAEEAYGWFVFFELPAVPIWCPNGAHS